MLEREELSSRLLLLTEIHSKVPIKFQVSKFRRLKKYAGAGYGGDHRRHNRLPLMDNACQTTKRLRPRRDTDEY